MADQKIVQTMMGAQQEMEQTVGMGCRFEVQAVDGEGVATVRVTYPAIRFRQKGPMGIIAYDSEKPPASVHPMVKGFAALVGQSFTMVVTPRGHVREVGGVSAMLEHVIEALDLPEGPMKEAMVARLKRQFGDQALKEVMGNMMVTYPAAPVGIGDTWPHRVTLTRGFPMTMDHTLTLKGREGGLATLAVRTKVEPDTGAPPLQLGPMKMTYSLSGTQEGTIQVDKAAGRTRRGTMKQRFTGSVGISGMPGIEGGQTWPISVESTVRFEPFEEKAAGGEL